MPKYIVEVFCGSDEPEIIEVELYSEFYEDARYVAEIMHKSECPNPMMCSPEAGSVHIHEYEHRASCGADVCVKCDDHKDLARCYCGWSPSGNDGYGELTEMGETIEEDY